MIFMEMDKDLQTLQTFPLRQMLGSRTCPIRRNC